MYEKLYRTRIGRQFAALMARPGVSRAVGRFMDSRASAWLIAPFRKLNNIPMQEVQPQKYKSFNAFFTRTLVPDARPIETDPRLLASPCDAFLTALPVSADGVFTVKGTPYTVETLTQRSDLARDFLGGWCLIFRLTPSHYHHYAFPDDGTILETGRIDGIFHTVRPEALGEIPVFKTNTREYALLETLHFGPMLYMEVGATMVGRIVNQTTSGRFQRGAEKGKFEFGGSTVILITSAGAFEPLPDIRSASASGAEYSVRLGQAVGSHP